MQTLATSAQLLHANAGLPDDVRQNMVKLDFNPPIPRLFVQEFLRIRMTGEMMLGGEDQPELAVSSRRCGKCGGPWVQKVSETEMKCLHPHCSWLHKRQHIAKPRGVCEVLIPSDCISVVDGRDVCSSVILVLDRRYREEVLAAVYRTAGMVCDQYGWKLL